MKKVIKEVGLDNDNVKFKIERNDKGVTAFIVSFNDLTRYKKKRSSLMNILVTLANKEGFNVTDNDVFSLGRYCYGVTTDKEINNNNKISNLLDTYIK